MHKKLTMACMTIAVFTAFGTASPAIAAPELTENMAKVAVGSSVKAASSGITKFTAGAMSVECTNVELKGTITQNTGTSIKYEVPAGNSTLTGTDKTTDCTGGALGAVKPTITSKLCFETVAGVDAVNITGCGGNVTATLDVTTGLKCNYKEPSITGTFPTGSDAAINVTEQPLESEFKFGCPNEIKVDLSLNLTTTDGTTLFITK